LRAIAAGRIQGAQRALAAARRYEAVVRRSIAALDAQSAVRSLPAVEGRPPLLVVLTSEQPLCGSFNQDVLALAERRWAELQRQGPLSVVVVGQRGVRQLASHDLMPEMSESAATSLPGLRDLVKRLARMIDGRYAAGTIGPLHVIYNRYQSVSEQVPTEEQILPLDLSRFPAPQPSSTRAGTALPPMQNAHYRYLPVSVLLAGLISEHAMISLYRMAADSFASEQASRLVAMDGATRNTEKMLEALQDLEQRERQGEITRQILELMAARFSAE
jgi:F-type H+-transporting ATPase subunit gamma